MGSEPTTVQKAAIYGKLERFLGPSAQIDGYGSQTVKSKGCVLTFGSGQLLVRMYTVCIPPKFGTYFLRYTCSTRPNVANLCMGILSLSVYE